MKMFLVKGNANGPIHRDANELCFLECNWFLPMWKKWFQTLHVIVLGFWISLLLLVNSFQHYWLPMYESILWILFWTCVNILLNPSLINKLDKIFDTYSFYSFMGVTILPFIEIKSFNNVNMFQFLINIFKIILHVFC